MTQSNSEKVWEFVERYMQKHKPDSATYAAFAIPIRKGNIYLATRNTPPFEGMFSAIGGKIEQSTEAIDLGTLSQRSQELVKLHFERPKQAALREFCEEMYAGRNCPDDFDINQYQIASVCDIADVATGVLCSMKALVVPDDEFNPSTREIGQIEQLRNIDTAQINPLTQLTLLLMKEDPTFKAYWDQIVGIFEVDYAGPIGTTYLLDYEGK